MVLGGSIDEHLDATMRSREGRLLDARRHFEAVLALEPIHPLARNFLGLDALANGDARAGADHLNRRAAEILMPRNEAKPREGAHRIG